MRHEALEIGFYALFVALAGAAYLIVRNGRDVAFKRRGFLVCGSLIWLLIGGFGLYGLWPQGAQSAPTLGAALAPFLAVPIALAGWLATVRMIRFCPNCARLCVDGAGISPPVRCSGCGTRL